MAGKLKCSANKQTRSFVTRAKAAEPNILMALLSFVFGDREAVLKLQAGPVPEFCLNHTRIGQCWGATRARMIVVRQVGGRFASLQPSPVPFCQVTVVDPPVARDRSMIHDIG